MINLSPKICLNCQKSLTGRSDKKFCDAYCRNSFNNQHKSDEEILIQAINSSQRKNRSILKSLCPEGKATVRKEFLDKLGYDYLHFTGLYKSQKGLLYYLVYDYGFAPIYEKDIQKVLIVQRQDYMNQPSFSIWNQPTSK